MNDNNGPVKILYNSGFEARLKALLEARKEVDIAGEKLRDHGDPSQVRRDLEEAKQALESELHGFRMDIRVGALSTGDKLIDFMIFNSGIFAFPDREDSFDMSVVENDAQLYQTLRAKVDRNMGSPILWTRRISAEHATDVIGIIGSKLEVALDGGRNMPGGYFNIPCYQGEIAVRHSPRTEFEIRMQPQGIVLPVPYLEKLRPSDQFPRAKIYIGDEILDVVKTDLTDSDAYRSPVVLKGLEKLGFSLADLEKSHDAHKGKE